MSGDLRVLESGGVRDPRRAETGAGALRTERLRTRAPRQVTGRSVRWAGQGFAAARTDERFAGPALGAGLRGNFSSIIAAL